MVNLYTKLRQIVEPTEAVARESQTISEVMGLMRRYGIYEIPVLYRRRPVGMVTYDVLSKRRRIPLTARVRNIMVPCPSLAWDSPLHRAMSLMVTTGHKAVAVTDLRGMFRGIVTRVGTLKAVLDSQELCRVRISEVQSQEGIPSVNEDTYLSEARHMMRSIDERSIPVMDRRGNAVGTVHMSDIVEMWLRQDRAKLVPGDKVMPRFRVRDVMRGTVPVAAPDDTLCDAISEMLEAETTYVLVVRDGRPERLISAWDMVEHLLSTLRGRKGVHIEITGLEEDVAVYDGIYWYLQKFLKKNARLCTPQNIKIHVKEVWKSKGPVRYELSIRLKTARKVFSTQSEHWDLFYALDLALGTAEKLLRKEKERTKKRK